MHFYTITQEQKQVTEDGQTFFFFWSQHNRTALHYAVAGKNKEAVKLLLQRRVKVDQKDKVGRFETPAPKTLRRMQQLM